MHYRSVGSILPWRVVPPASDKIPRVPSYSGYPSGPSSFEYRAFTFFGVPSQTLPLPFIPLYRSYNPSMQAYWFGLFRVRSPLLAESLLITLPLGTKMFQFPRFALHGYFTYHAVTIISDSRVTPFRNPRIKACLTAPRGISLPNKRLSSPPTAKISTIHP